MRRRLFSILSALSLLLCVAVVVLWVRSYIMPDAVAWTGAGRLIEWSIHSKRGRIGIEGIQTSNSVATAASRWTWDSGDSFWAPWDWPDGAVPYWHLFIYTGALPLVWWTVYGRHAVLRRYRVTRRLCPSCGYDLRATPERCPECGELAKSVGVGQGT
jgi:hypothetical protein